MNRSRATLYGFSFRHHGQFWSIHRLLHYAGHCHRVDATLPLQKQLPAALCGKLESRWRRFSEWRLRPVFARSERQCVHYLYPGQSLFHGQEWKGRHGLVLTCHSPAAWLQQAGRFDRAGYREALQNADRVIVLSEDSLAGYETLCERRRLVVIPHGVDVHFFHPAAGRKRKPLVLTVGNWLRDYGLWAEVALRLAAKLAEVEFAVVADPEVVVQVRARVELALPGRVRFLSGLSDGQLRNLYQQAAVVFLPLLGATANNALLEAMACGTPLLVTDLPATREYARGAEFFSPGAIEDCVGRLAAMLGDETRLEILGQAARQQAVERYAWEIIAERHWQLYSEVLAEG